ncbi:hypothetical protein NITHO_100013 [Nitrolancea hollandica Lb]|uniref:Uncharacterized protein n=1 Tax=Nitrolancea hollandica Lb TaxID=1129897 RepID=I4EC85_9BACT|nr:hypothetical protein NITHO_100013 [Nitrolancea hollandica Lb]
MIAIQYNFNRFCTHSIPRRQILTIMLCTETADKLTKKNPFSWIYIQTNFIFSDPDESILDSLRL